MCLIIIFEIFSKTRFLKIFDVLLLLKASIAKNTNNLFQVHTKCQSTFVQKQAEIHLRKN